MTDTDQQDQPDESELVDPKLVSLVEDLPPVRIKARSDTTWKIELLILVGSSAIVFASFFLSVDRTSMVTIPILEKQTPSLCPMKSTTGIDCPGCGLSRGMIFLAHGHFHDAWTMNPAVFLIGAIIFFQIPLRSYNLYQLRRNIYYRPLPFPVWLGWIVVSALILQWTVRMIW